MIRTSWMPSLVAIVVMVCAAAELLGQEDRAPRAAYSSLIYWTPISQLVNQKDILSDLKLTVDQQESVRKALLEYQQQRAISANQLRGGEPSFTEVIQKQRDATQKLDEAIRAVLGDKSKRLDQIAAQSVGLAAFVTRTDLRQQLAITDEQMTKGKEILEATYKEVLAIAGTPFVSSWGASGAANRTTFVDKTTPKLLELLTDKQKLLWQEAIGEPVPAATLVQARTTPTGDVRTGTRGWYGEPRDGVAFAYGSLVYWAPISESVTKEDIQRDMKLTADQLDSIRKAQAEYQQVIDTNPLFRAQNLGEQLRKHRDAFTKRDEVIRAALGDRAHRLDQIAAQSAGLAAFVTRTDVRQQLAITDEQLSKGKEILEATYREMLEAAGTPFVASSGVSGAANRTTFVDKTTPKLLELLTDKQKLLWQEANGEPVPPTTLVQVRTSEIARNGIRDDRTGNRGNIETGRASRGASAPGFGGSYMPLSHRAPLSTLLTQDEVIRDLKLTDDQLDAIRKAQAEYQQVIDTNQLGRGQNLTEVLQKQNEAFQRELAALRTVLGDKSKRLDQINAQSAGLAWFVIDRNPDGLRQQLKITDEQLTKGREILDAAYQEMGREGQAVRGPMIGAQGAEIRTTFVDKTTPRLLELLTDEQKQLWQEAIGEPVPAATLLKIRTSSLSEGPSALPPQIPGSRTYEIMATRLYQEARDLEKSQDYPAAVQKMKEALEIAPDNDEYLAYASHVERLAGNYADGVEHALQAVKINEKKVGWYYASVAFNAHAKGDRELTRVYCKKVIDFGVEVVGQANYDYAKKLLDKLEGKK